MCGVKESVVSIEEKLYRVKAESVGGMRGGQKSCVGEGGQCLVEQRSNCAG